MDIYEGIVHPSTIMRVDLIGKIFDILWMYTTIWQASFAPVVLYILYSELLWTILSSGWNLTCEGPMSLYKSYCTPE